MFPDKKEIIGLVWALFGVIAGLGFVMCSLVFVVEGDFEPFRRFLIVLPMGAVFCGLATVFLLNFCEGDKHGLRND